MLQLSNGVLFFLILFLVSFILQLYFYLRYFLHLPEKKHATVQSEEGVSIIIAAKDEADNLRQFLPIIMEQHYSNFEVIVVNDHSKDESLSVLQFFSKKYKKLNYRTLEGEEKGKKAAIQRGIKVAKYDVFLFTDADCWPASNRWIKQMMMVKTNGMELILGYGSYQKRKGWLNKLIRYDTLITGIKYLSFAGKGEAYMAVGRNFMYSRKLFNSSSAFQKHHKIPYGDDDLFANEMAKSFNTTVCMDKSAHTISKPKKKLSQFFLQKIRHLKAGILYKKSDKFILTLEWASKLFLFLSAAILLLIGLWQVLLFVFIILLLQYIVVYRAVQKLGDDDLFKYVAILDIAHLCFISFCGFYSLINKKVSWK